MPGPRAKAKIPLFVIIGLVSHLVVFGVLVMTLGAIAGLDDGISTAPTSGVAPTTAARPPAPIVVDSVVSGDSVVVSDGINRAVVTISGIDAPLL